jgi:hypothetical protein
MQSIIKERSPVTFPRFTGERVYMRPFFQSEGLPVDLARWQPTVDAMLDGIATDAPIYLMIDQRAVRAGIPHRRPGVHIDGYWNPATGRHDDTPTHFHGGHMNTRHEALLLASDIAACRGFVGDYEGTIGEGGDCSTLDLSSLKIVNFKSDRCYAGNVTALHESLPVPHDCLRTLVRLNVPGHVVR